MPLPSRERPAFEDLLEPLYGSLLDPARSDEFGKKLALAMDAHLVALQVDDGCHRHDIRKHLAGGSDANASAGDRDDATINQFFLKGSDRLIRNGFLSSTGMFASGELERTAFYRDVLVPYDVLHGVGILLHREDSGSITSLTVNRDRRRPPFGGQEDRLLKRLLPHLQNVYALQQRLQCAGHMASALDRLPTAAWNLDRDRKVLHANEPALRLLEQPHGCIRWRHQRLSPAWKADRPAFLQAVTKATRGADSSRTRLVLHDSSGQPNAICTFHPLLQGNCGSWMLPGQPAALLLLAPLAPRATASVELLRQAYGLTPAEAQLAQALLRHGSLAACRGALNKSHETLRTQLKSLFAKTGTRRQSELLLKLQELMP